ncbi:hypothetical protein Tco_1256939, partial [Tanacetum coccineum]
MNFLGGEVGGGGPVSAMEGQSQEGVDAGRYQTFLLSVRKLNRSSIMLLYLN